ncbi:hypothetical protein Cni_G05840 [Canna indica]|uniref:RRM domain-containing protein n=1 Tax=Canna indica TaxID=4628 RepID=A0AAQ3Q5S2_9LILI|nr:hypothetical protein Cni_G05840 [Canna indica]
MTRRGKRERTESDPFPASLSARLRRRLSAPEAEEEPKVVNGRPKPERSQFDHFPSKRHRPSLPPPEAAEGEAPAASSSPSLVMVTGLPYDCTVLELKSHLEVYGPISRTRIDVDCRGFVTFRSNQAAEAAIAASMDPTIGVSIRSKKVLVVRAIEDPLQAKKGVRISPTSKLLRPEMPLSKYGRSNKKLGAGTAVEITKSRAEIPSESREIVAYDDLF